MFYESINTKLSNYPCFLVPQTHHNALIYSHDNSFTVHTQSNNKNSRNTCIRLYFMQPLMCVSIGLKPSRQCSCRLTHRFLHCMPGPGLNSVSQNVICMKKKILSSKPSMQTRINSAQGLSVHSGWAFETFLEMLKLHGREDDRGWELYTENPGRK